MTEQDEGKGNGFDTEDEKRRPPPEKNEDSQTDRSADDEGFPIEPET